MILGGEEEKNRWPEGSMPREVFSAPASHLSHRVRQLQPSPWELEKGSRQFWGGGLGAGPSYSPESGETAIGGALCNTETFWNLGKQLWTKTGA